MTITKLKKQKLKTILVVNFLCERQQYIKYQTSNMPTSCDKDNDEVKRRR